MLFRVQFTIGGLKSCYARMDMRNGWRKSIFVSGAKSPGIAARFDSRRS
jgi:hypothetical protein